MEINRNKWRLIVTNVGLSQPKANGFSPVRLGFRALKIVVDKKRVS